MSEAKDERYYLLKAEQCFRLAGDCTDARLATSLRELGYEFVDEALVLGAEPSALPKEWLRPK